MNTFFYSVKVRTIIMIMKQSKNQLRKVMQQKIKDQFGQ